MFRTIAGMIGVVTAVLIGSSAGLHASVAADHSALAGFVTGGVVGATALLVLMWHHYRAWDQAHMTRLFEDDQESPHDA